MFWPGRSWSRRGAVSECSRLFLVVRQRVIGGPLLLLLRLLLLLLLRRRRRRQRGRFFSSSSLSWQRRCVTASAASGQLPLAAPLPPSFVPLPGFFLAPLLLVAP